MAEPVNAHAILEQPPNARRSQTKHSSGPERVLLLTGSTLTELKRQLRVPDTHLLDRDDAGTPSGDGPCRLAIIAPTARRLALARRIVEQGTSWRGREDIWFTATPLRPEPAPGQLAFVFPGLEQGFEPRVDDVADHFGLERPDLGDTAILGRHGLGVFTVGRLLDAALREFGVIPDLVAGHSVGEWNAMTSASIYPRSAVEESVASFDPATLHVPGLVFAALGCGAQQAVEAIGGRDGVVVSHDNCPHQSIICGAEAAVVEVLSLLQERGVTGQVLPFQSGFHTPMLRPYLRRILDTFGNLPVRPPALPIWSATTVDRYPDDPDRIRDLTTRHLLEPVRFGPLIRRLHETGVRAFVQVGTGSLTAFVADTLAGLPHLAVTANTPRRSGLDQLRRVATALWVEGWTPRFDRLPCASRIGASRFGAAHTPNRDAHALPAELPAAGHPVLAEFDAALRDAAAAARAVADAWATTPARRVTRTHATTTRVLSLDTMPYIADHCLVRQPADWPEAADRYPVVPLATMVELMAQAARDLVPGRTVVGVRDIRAMRFLAVAPPVTGTIDAALDAEGNVAVAIDGYARGTVLLADGYPAPPDKPDQPLCGERPCEVTAAALYGDRWMFHGPRFQGVAELGPISDDGIRGMLAAMSAPGALLDSAGQLLGFWIMKRMSADRLAFPVAVEQVRWYGPQPHPGDRTSCVIRVGSVTDTEVVADLELRASGRLWARIERWTCRRFGTDDVTWPLSFIPERHRIAERGPGTTFLVKDRWPDTGSRELVIRHYLGAAERADYERRNPRAARQWLLGRIAVKDAVRQWLWDAGAGPIYPVEITVGNDERGRPFVTGPFDAPPAVSLAHSGSLAAAIVDHPDFREPPGIDIELVEARDARTEAAIMTEAERGLLDEVCSRSPDPHTARAGWLTRFWTAKEAVAKAEGTGLGGRPHRFVVERVDSDGLLVRTQHDSGYSRARWVRTALGATPEPYALAWTTLDQPDERDKEGRRND